MTTFARFIIGALVLIFLVLYPDRAAMLVTALWNTLIHIVTTFGNSAWIPGSNGSG